MRRTSLNTVALTFAAALALASAVALGQQPGQPPPPGQAQPGQPGQPRPFPPGHPGVPGMPGLPGGHPPVILGPNGRPQGQPAQPPGGHGRPPGARPGMPTPRRPQPRVQHEEHEEHGGGEHECPGHGADDAPPHINYWHGMLMVDNERALQPGFVNQLLFRYQNPKDPCDERNEPAPYMASLLNFGLLAFVLYRFGRKPLGDALLKRKQGIMADIDTATRLKEDAEARLDDYEDKLDNIEQKLEEVRAEYAAQAEVEKTHILAEAEERRVRMRRDAEFRVDQERKAMREELLREAVVSATAAAEALIQKQMSSADQDRMATSYLATVGASLAAGGARGATSKGAQPS